MLGGNKILKASTIFLVLEIQSFGKSRVELLSQETKSMDYHINEFFQRLSQESPKGHFVDVIPMHENSDLSWAEVIAKVPKIPKGWFELSRISSKDRVEFTCDHWCDTLPTNPNAVRSIQHFFESLDDIGIFIVRRKEEKPYEVQMVYSLKDNGGFYRGALPADERAIAMLQKAFDKYLLPADYLAFLRLHDGFWKTTDSTGIIFSKNVPMKYEEFQEMLAKLPVLTTTIGEVINPTSLIPFYESFGMPYYQCFWGDWYPEQEMGNVYYSSETKTISNIKSGDPAETMAFPTFVDWLAFYLERID